VAARVVPTSGAPLVVFGTVLPWLGSSWSDITARNGAAFSAALEAQSSDWRALRASHPDHDIVVAGDFNQDLANTHFYGSRANRQKLLSVLECSGLVAHTAAANDVNFNAGYTTSATATTWTRGTGWRATSTCHGARSASWWSTATRCTN
jgi:hypothetical protein